MFYGFGARQQQLLKGLLEHKSGLTVDELTRLLGITRTAVNQHLLALERSGYIAKDKLTKTGGRPGYTYVLTEQGLDLFPKQYAWFSQLLLDSLKEELGSAGLGKYLGKLGSDLSATLKQRMQDAGSQEARIAEAANILQELGYDAGVSTEADATPAIDAHNCVYHHLAREHSEICQFDISLLSSLLEAKVDHTSCMARGDHKCRFKIGRSK
jgi:DeoR family suf operon transcriptional repressor